MKNNDLISIYEIIEKFLKPNELQKKKNGEVFTPLGLIREMLDKIPEDFWTNKNVKVLDPCCGIGNFQIVLIEKFMSGLVEEIQNSKSF
jgi:type I restriction-modification system DNA methylase subunit